MNKPKTKTKQETKAPPKTDAEWAARSCRLVCKMGRDTIYGKINVGGQPLEYALFLLLHAIEDLSLQIELSNKTK